MRVAIVSLAAALLAAVAAAAACWASLLAHLERPADPRGADRVVVFEPGAGAPGALARLEALGLVRPHPLLGVFAARMRAPMAVVPGEYVLSPSMTLAAQLDALAAGRVRLHTVALPPGLGAGAAVDALAAAGLAPADALAALARDPDLARAVGAPWGTLDGLLGAQVLQVPRGLGARALLERAVAERRRALDALGLGGPEPDGLDRADRLRLAALIEASPVRGGARRLLAGVLLNRLRAGLPLPGRDLPGLPAVPPGAPGDEAVLAVLSPAATRALIAVPRDDGGLDLCDEAACERAVLERRGRGGR